MSDAWLGIDLGTQSARVVVIDETGRRLALLAASLTSTRDGDRHEQDPAEWLRVVEGLLRRAAAQLPKGTTVQALAVSGTSGTIVPLDDRGHPVGPAAMYDDRRGASYLAEVQRQGDQVWERLGYRMQATWGLPKLLRMRDAHGSGVVFGHQPDVVTSRLIGRRAASDLSSALKTGADLDGIAWPADVFDALGLPLDAITDLVASGAVIGAVTREAAEATGLPEGCAVVAGSTDGCAAQFAAGALAPGSWNSVLGTTLVLKGVAVERRPDPQGVVYAHRAPFGVGWLPGGASNTGARSISALMPHADLERLTAAMAARDDVPVAYPLVGVGERFPFVSGTAHAVWPGGRVPDDESDLFRCIAFGIAFLERYAMEMLASLGYDTAGPVHLTGGGARNPWWNALRAAVLDRPCVLPAETEGAAGMALLAAAAADPPAPSGGGDDALRATAGRLLGPAREVGPLQIDRGALDDAYASFTGLIAPWLVDTAEQQR